MKPPEGEEKPKTEENQQPTTEPNPEEVNGSVEGSLDASNSSNPTKIEKETPEESPKGKAGIKGLIRKFDIYFLIFIFIIVVSMVVAYIAVQKNKSAKPVSISTQTLDQNALRQVNNNDVQVGGTNQTLDIQSSTIFSGNVLVKSGLQVAGSLKVAGTLSLPGITVSGTTDLGQVNATTLTLTGAETVKGQLTVDQGITVNGIAQFSGALNASAINVTSLEVNGDMTYSHQIYTTGSIPKSTQTSAIGAGGTSAMNGTDTAGSVSINTGTNPSAGCLVDITFTRAYATTPYITITPVGSGSGGNIGYYITKSLTGFNICANNPPQNTPMRFDYQVIG